MDLMVERHERGGTGEIDAADRWRLVVDRACHDVPGAEVLVAAHLVGSERRWTLDAERVVPAASTIKTAILVTLYRAIDAGELTLDDRHPVTAVARVPGSGVLTWMSPELVLSVADLAYLMIAVSDNTASNLLLEVLGLERVRATIDALGMHRTELRRPFVGRAVAPGEPDNLTCATDLVALLSGIAAATAATVESCARIRATLSQQQDRARLARFLPTTSGFAGKSGSLDGIVHDTGLLDTSHGPLAVAVLTRDLPDPYAAEALIGRIAEALVAEIETVASRPFPPE
jgi:beta-lactamase class A